MYNIALYNRRFAQLIVGGRRYARWPETSPPSLSLGLRLPLVLTLCVAIFVVDNMAQPLPSGTAILQKLEDQQRFALDIQAHVLMTQKKAGQGSKILDMQYYRRDSDDSFLIHILGPESERGNGYLRTGDHLWMYRRNTRSFQHVNRDESIGGSDAKADDFETRNIVETWGVRKDAQGHPMISWDLLGKLQVIKLQVMAKVNDIDYPQKTWWVSADQFLLLKEESYSTNGTLMQTAYFVKYTQIEGRFMPVNMIFNDEFEKGNRTVVQISEIKTGKLDPQIFTKPYLENLSK
jgi:hypothetical protein